MTKPMTLVIVGPNLRGQSRGSFNVHAISCTELERDPNLCDENQDYVLFVSSAHEVVEQVYADIIVEGSDVDGLMDDFYFAPCCGRIARMNQQR
jgi:hypothetical protein